VAGTITAGGNLVPDLLQGVRQAVLAGQDPMPIQDQVNAVRGWLERSPSMHAATKFLLTRFAGLPQSAVRPPLVDLSEAQRADLAAQAAPFLAQRAA
jgi:dihydrodipicolinate synthase/N-acetylneuraminate lyase